MLIYYWFNLFSIHKNKEYKTEQTKNNFKSYHINFSLKYTYYNLVLKEDLKTLSYFKEYFVYIVLGKITKL